MHAPDQRPHLHHDPLAGRTVVVAPGRANRPNELAGGTVRCPFCAGNESLTPPDLLRAPRSAAEPWRSRIVPNRFPIVTGVAAVDRAATGPTASLPSLAHGVHDVVIESPEHVGSILAIDPGGWREVWELCRERLAMLAARGDLAWATVFKNSGIRAGASLEHVHSQLVGLEFVPPAIQTELVAAGRSADPFGACLRRAAAEGRLVEQSGDLVALVPPAPRQPFETWILPRQAEWYFHETAPVRVAALAALTRSIIGRVDRIIPGAHYNWWLHQPPFPVVERDFPAAAIPAGWHWHLEIMPRINGLAGFELGAGCHVTTMTPHDSARLLRETQPDGEAGHFSHPA
jgi:UDPglucose--hexose-1-phosphate uridylyltransferase